LGPAREEFVAKLREQVEHSMQKESKKKKEQHKRNEVVRFLGKRAIGNGFRY